MKYKVEITTDSGEVVFKAEKPTLEMLEESIGAFERNN